MEITFLGVRGSYPVFGGAFSQFGGDTSCVCFSKVVNGETHRVIVDAGTGIIPLGHQLIESVRESKDLFHIHILLTHFHMDHIQGLPHFLPIHHPNTALHLYGMNLGKTELQDILAEHISGATFPVAYPQMRSTKLHYTIFHRSTFPIGPFMIHVMRAGPDAHPANGCLYFRIEDRETKKSVACLWDHEAKEHGNEDVLEFIEGVDVLIHDTQYTTKDYFSKTHAVKGYGHSSYAMAIRAAKKAKVKDKLICFHYNPQHTDETLLHIERTRQATSPIPLLLPRQGQTLII